MNLDASPVWHVRDEKLHWTVLPAKAPASHLLVDFCGSSLKIASTSLGQSLTNAFYYLTVPGEEGHFFVCELRRAATAAETTEQVQDSVERSGSSTVTLSMRRGSLPRLDSRAAP